MITSDCHVFSWGSNQNAKLGHSYFRPSPNELQSSQSIQIVKHPCLIKSLEFQRIDAISCGTNHVFAWSSETGLVFGWGLGLNGRLGNEFEGVVQEPQVLECLRDGMVLCGMRVREVACGENHTLALIEMAQDATQQKTTKLWVWGNNDKYQLGMDNQDSSEDPPVSAKEIQVPHQLDPDPFSQTDDQSPSTIA